MSFQQILKKWYIILFCAIICAAGLYLEKSVVNPPIVQSGDMTYIRVVKFNTVPVFTAGQNSNEIAMDDLMKAWPNLSDLIMQLDQSYEMEKVDKQWKTLSQTKKFDWVNNHFRTDNIGPGMYELILQFPKKDPKDPQYLAKNINRLLDDYESYFQKTSSLVTNDTNLTTVKEFQLNDDQDAPTQTQVEKKYAIIGFILGALVGVVIVTVWNKRKEHLKGNKK